MSHVANAAEIVRETHCNIFSPCRTSGEIFAQQMDISRLSEQLKDLIDIVSLVPHARVPALKACPQLSLESLPGLYSTDSLLISEEGYGSTNQPIFSKENSLLHEEACVPTGVCECSAHLNRASSYGPASSASQWQAHL